MLDALIAALEYELYVLLEKCIETLYMHWDSDSAGFNNGQLVIFYDYLTIALTDSTLNIEDNWPSVSSYDYVDTMYYAYDPDVMERAFSDAIWGPVERMDEIIYRAQEIAGKLEFLEAIAGL